MRTLLLLGAVAVLVVLWTLNGRAGVDLRSQIAALRQENSEIAALRAERDHLEERRAAAQVATLPPAAPAPALPVASRVPTGLTVGEWLPPRDWTNRGQHTPAAAVESALWAAAGGDISAFQSLLHLDEEVRAQANALLATLPPAGRSAYPTAEDLIAAFATKSIPLGEAQLIWQHEYGNDEAMACLFVRDPDVPPEPQHAPVAVMSREEAVKLAQERARLRTERVASDVPPPMGQPNPETKAVYLSLRRTETGWRLLVPSSAIEKIGKELGGPK